MRRYRGYASWVLALLAVGSTGHSETKPPAPAPGPAGAGATWITLGTTGGPPLHAAAAPIANALVVGDDVYLFDVGNSVLQGDWQWVAPGAGPRALAAGQGFWWAGEGGARPGQLKPLHAGADADAPALVWIALQRGAAPKI